jgi:hypothetical protein
MRPDCSCRTAFLNTSAFRSLYSVSWCAPTCPGSPNGPDHQVMPIIQGFLVTLSGYLSGSQNGPDSDLCPNHKGFLNVCPCMSVFIIQLEDKRK